MKTLLLLLMHGGFPLSLVFAATLATAKLIFGDYLFFLRDETEQNFFCLSSNTLCRYSLTTYHSWNAPHCEIADCCGCQRCQRLAFWGLSDWVFKSFKYRIMALKVIPHTEHQSKSIRTRMQCTAPEQHDIIFSNIRHRETKTVFVIARLYSDWSSAPQRHNNVFTRIKDKHDEDIEHCIFMFRIFWQEMVFFAIIIRDLSASWPEFSHLWAHFSLLDCC